MNAMMRDELLEIEEIEKEGEKERFKITNLESANWAFRKLKAIAEKEREIDELVEKEIERIKSWASKDKEQLDNSRKFFESLLEEYYREQREVDPKFRISTPYGRVSSRRQQPKWNYNDRELLDWLKENQPELIRVKEEPNKVEIRKAFKVAGENVVTEDGEIVEGITIEEREPKVTIKVVD